MDELRDVILKWREQFSREKELADSGLAFYSGRVYLLKDILSDLAKISNRLDGNLTMREFWDARANYMDSGKSPNYVYMTSEQLKQLIWELYPELDANALDRKAQKAHMLGNSVVRLGDSFYFSENEIKP